MEKGLGASWYGDLGRLGSVVRELRGREGRGLCSYSRPKLQWTSRLLGVGAREGIVRFRRGAGDSGAVKLARFEMRV